MRRFEKNHIEWLEFDLLSNIPKLHHAVFLRSGGVSEGPFSSLNFDYTLGDNPKHVDENFIRIKKHLSDLPNWQKLVRNNAAHLDHIALIQSGSEDFLIDHDGLISQTVGISLLTKHADCQIALFYDPINHAVANIHAGWRGSVKNIYAKTVHEMKHHFGSDPANLLVCISPSLCPDHAEFIHYRTELPEDFWPFQVRPNYFDFWAISENQLQKAGILTHHIEIARLSTYSNPNDYFSHRRDKVRGCNGTCITLL
jgi:YfiH family protein